MRHSVDPLARQQAQEQQRRIPTSAGVPTTAAALAGIEPLERVRRLTETMFPGEVSVEVEADPQCPHEQFIVFQVTASGETAELIRRHHPWHEQVLLAAPDTLNLFRLSVTPA